MYHLFIFWLTCSLKLAVQDKTQVFLAGRSQYIVESNQWRKKDLSCLWEKYISFVCLFLSALNDIFHWQAHLLILTRSVWCRYYLYLCHQFLKIVTYHLQIFYILTLNHQVNRLYKLKITKDRKQSLVVLQLEY